MHERIAGAAVAHQHFSLHTIGAEGIHKAVGGNGCSASGFASVDDENFHPSENSISDKNNQKSGYDQIKCGNHVSQ